jgi:hypothetical protein
VLRRRHIRVGLPKHIAFATATSPDASEAIAGLLRRRDGFEVREKK